MSKLQQHSTINTQASGTPSEPSTFNTQHSTIPIRRRFQSYRGTWAWLIQRISAIGLFLLIPVKIYSGWAARSKVPDLPAFLGSARKVHFNAALDILLLLFFLLHGFYGLRVILIDFGVIREDRFFWRTLALAVAIFGGAVWFVYVREG